MAKEIKPLDIKKPIQPEFFGTTKHMHQTN
jgi:hypothetical protein